MMLKHNKIKIVMMFTLPVWIIIFGTACQGLNKPVLYEKNLMNITHLVLPVQEDYWPIYLQNGNLLVISKLGPESGLPSNEDNIYIDYSSDNQNAHPLPLPHDNSCSVRTDYAIMGLLPDGRIGIFKTCFPSTGKIERYLMALDWQTKTLQQIVTSALPYGDMNFKFTWNPDMTRGVQEVTNRLDSTIYWITPETTAPIDITISDGKNSSWSLEDAYFDALGADKNFGLAQEPAWSPNGKQIAFLASLEAMKYDGISRMFASKNLYFLDPSTENLTLGLENIFSDELAWSSDSMWLAFNGRLGGSSPSGLWLFAPQTDHLVLIYEGEDIRTITWEPNMEHIIISKCIEADCLNSHLGVFMLETKEIIQNTQQ